MAGDTATTIASAIEIANATIISTLAGVVTVVDVASASGIAVVLYEGYKFKKFERDTVTKVATFFVLATGLLFSHYYIPDIIEMQNQGEAVTKSAAFINTHKGSEVNFKIFSLALLVLIVQNMRKACK